MSKLDPEFKKKWCEALRSGEYKQGMHCLRSNDDKFCCLGVAADIICGRMAWTLGFGGWTIEGEDVGASISVQRAGLNEDEMMDLIGMNDGGKPFPEIADYIEQNL